jgi:hypothetical protein
MLISVAVVPGPPALVTELMGSAAHELDDLRQAVDSVVSAALSDLLLAATGVAPPVGATSVKLIVVGAGAAGEFNAAGPVSFSSFGRDVLVPPLVEGEQSDRELPTPLMVARYLASRDLAAHPEHTDLWASARWVTTDGADASALGEQLREDGALVALILVADGAACHGPKAPRAEDSRAEAYDDEVCSALSSGHPAGLAQLDAYLGVELGATGPQVWPVLVAAGDDRASTVRWIGEVLWSGAPYGVGWAVAAWRRPLASATVTDAAHGVLERG